jgi:2-polyprenyl-3-methyl-5-hydroxy-6-metoxy-1,4-benzoquinol methylase
LTFARSPGMLRGRFRSHPNDEVIPLSRKRRMELDLPLVELQEFLDVHFDGRADLRVLEAGCGSLVKMRLPPGTHIVGIDISEKQLLRNQSIVERIVGDLQTHELPAASYDMIVCWDVLEHLPHPQSAVERLFRATKVGGIVILAMPNVSSLKGQVTKYSPHWFHVWMYRNVFGRKLAGTEDHGPFKTFLDPSIAAESIRRFAVEHRFSEVFFRLYETHMQRSTRKKVGLVGPVWSVVQGLTRLFTFGRIDPLNSDFIMVLHRDS